MTLVDPEKMDKWETSEARVIPKVNSLKKDGTAVAPASALSNAASTANANR